MFSFQNGTGSVSDFRGGHHNNHLDMKGTEVPEAVAVQLCHNYTRAWATENSDGTVEKGKCHDPMSFAIATRPGKAGGMRLREP